MTIETLKRARTKLKDAEAYFMNKPEGLTHDERACLEDIADAYSNITTAIEDLEDLED